MRHARFSSTLCLCAGVIAAGFAFFIGAAHAAPIVTDDDAIALLSQTLGGWDLAGIAWANMNPSEKQSVRDQAAQIASMAEAARRDGIDSRPQISLTLKWGTGTLLAEEWRKQVVASTDLSESTVRAFYEANSVRYLDEGAVRFRKAVWPSKQKDAAVRVKKQLQATHLDRFKNSVAVDWTAFDKLEPRLAKAVQEAPLHKIMGPLETSGGVLLYEVLERRDAGPVPLEQCVDRVKEDMIQYAIKSRLP